MIFANLAAQRRALLHGGQRRQINISKEWNYRYVPFLENVFKWGGESVTQQRVVGIRNLKTRVNQFFQKVLSHFPIV